MSSLVELHSQIDEALNVNDVNSVFSTDYYTDLINNQRSLHIRNEYNKRNRTIDPGVIQDLGCLETELVDATTCCDLSIPLDCKATRTKKKIPSPIEFHNSNGITRIGPVDIIAKPFSHIHYNRVPYTGNGRVNQNSIFAFEYDNYIYLFSKDPKVHMIENINVRGVFEDPTEVANFTTCTNKVCWTPEDEYPLKDWMWEYMKPYIVQQLMQNKLCQLMSLPILKMTKQN